MTTQTHVSGRFSVDITSYAGHEAALLEVRNRNRRVQQEQRFLDWRYARIADEPEPRIFWLLNSASEPVATTGVVFRRYLVDAEPKLFAVVGDISVDVNLRGLGLSKKLYAAVNHFISEEKPACGFVMAKPFAAQGMVSSGWQKGDGLVSLVWGTNLSQKFKDQNYARFLLSKGTGRVWRRLISSQLKRYAHESAGICARDTAILNPGLNKLWSSMSKQGLVLRDRSMAAWHWRFSSIAGQFRFIEFLRSGELLGMAVCREETEGLCMVEEFLVADPRLARPCFAVLLKRALDDSSIATVRLTVNTHSHYARTLRTLAAVRRERHAGFHIFAPRETLLLQPSAWLIMASDKDA